MRTGPSPLLTASAIFALAIFAICAEEPSMAEKPEDPKIAAAASAAEAWLKLADEGQYEKTWQSAAEYFRKTVGRKQWMQSFSAIRGAIGKNTGRKSIGMKFSTSLPGAPDGEYVTIIYQSEFEKKKAAVETITPMLDKDGIWRVSGYYIK